MHLPMIGKTEEHPSDTKKNPAIRIISNKLYRQIILLVLFSIFTVVMIFAATKAWYSNVVSSQGLQFEASPWGFEGNVTVPGDRILASPGSSGSVAFSVTNPTDQTTSVSISVSKNAMHFDLQQRLFFYADESKTVNGETVDKQYLNKRTTYSYTLLSGQNLVLNGEQSNNTQIKWEWVYDVVGYYLLGTVQDGVQPTVEDYLRPVEYDYDHATFDPDGKLQTVDGNLTADGFLSALTAGDGYAGSWDPDTMSASVKTVDGNSYYPVETDENGYGVWICLCNKSEIEASMSVDNTLGTTQTPFSASLNVVGQQKRLNLVEVSENSAFFAALQDPDCDMVKLTGPLSIDSVVTITAGNEKILDLNGYTLTTETPGDLFTVEDGASLYVKGGKIVGSADKQTHAFVSSGGNLTLSGLKAENLYRAVYVNDPGHGDSQVVISGCDLESRDPTVMVFGNGLRSERLTRVVIEDSTITSTGYIGIVGNGTSSGDGFWGTEIVVKNSTVSGYWGGVFQPQQSSSMLLVNSKISGFTAVAVKGGSVSIENCQITGGVVQQGTVPAPQTPAFSSSGFTDTGDGIYLETNYGWPIQVNISGERTVVTTEQASAMAVRVYEAQAAHATVEITGGKYGTNVSAFVASGYTTATAEDGKTVVTKIEGEAP